MMQPHQCQTELDPNTPGRPYGQSTLLEHQLAQEAVLEHLLIPVLHLVVE